MLQKMFKWIRKNNSDGRCEAAGHGDLNNSMDIVFNLDTDNDAFKDVEETFEAILDWTDNIGMANNFHKIGGFEGLK